MRVAADAALRLRPAQHRQRPRRPALAAVRAGIDLLLQIEQADVAERLRAEAADLDVVFHQRQRLAALVGRRREKLLLMIEARAPRQHAADVEPLALDLAEHVGRIHAFGRRRVVRAARPRGCDGRRCRSRAPPDRSSARASRRFPRCRPRDRPVGRRGNRHGALDPPILGPAAVEHRELAGRQQHVLAVAHGRCASGKTDPAPAASPAAETRGPARSTN